MNVVTPDETISYHQPPSPIPPITLDLPPTVPLLLRDIISVTQSTGGIEYSSVADDKSKNLPQKNKDKAAHHHDHHNSSTTATPTKSNASTIPVESIQA